MSEKNLIGSAVRFILILNLTFISFTGWSQCPQGAIGVAGAGCGCMASCNLTAFGGPNCGAGVAGNCTAGYLPMSVDITVPDGCTFTVTATMMIRPGTCTASGADGSCGTCDALKVDIPGGPKPMQSGGGNATLTDSYTLAGPATIRVSGSANRADEIITYSTTFSGVNCVACMSILPIELMNFDALWVGEMVELTWATASELNSDYFTLERSIDGENFETFLITNASGNSSSRTDYKVYDSSPGEDNIMYYRIKQVDLDGVYIYSNIVSVMRNKLITTYSDGYLYLNLADNSAKYNLLNIYNIQGQLVYTAYLEKNETELIEWHLSGVFVVNYPEIGITEKVFVP